MISEISQCFSEAEAVLISRSCGGYQPQPQNCIEVFSSTRDFTDLSYKRLLTPILVIVSFVRGILFSFFSLSQNTFFMYYNERGGSLKKTECWW